MSGIEESVLEITGATAIQKIESVQTLWSGYGTIKRYFLEDGCQPSIIVKQIDWGNENSHPRGWNTKLSHQRKVRSYEVEKHWYGHHAKRTNNLCKIPKIFEAVEWESGALLIMEDLDAVGYNIRLKPETITVADAKNCLTWLANFHGLFMSSSPEGLWPIGTYWHLDTRPDEWNNMRHSELKKIAGEIDSKLNNAKFQTIVHGDAKLANFCFTPDGNVAAVDFQYVGKGCGMKDVVYFIGSCFDDHQCEQLESVLLDHYFNQLQKATHKTVDFQQVIVEWQSLYAYAWADFYRFLDGWSPGHWKMHNYSIKLTEQVIEEITNERTN